MTVTFELNQLAVDIVSSHEGRRHYPEDLWIDHQLKGILGYVTDRDPWGNQYRYSIMKFKEYECFLLTSLALIIFQMESGIPLTFSMWAGCVASGHQ